MLKDYSNEKINSDRVIKILLIHDLGEIYAGDTIIYSSETSELKDKDAAGVVKLLSFLPESKCEEYMIFWHEFETGETLEARFAKAIVRVPPLLHNIHNSGQTWKKQNISKEQVFSLNSRNNNGNLELWKIIKSKLEQAVVDGILT